MTSINRRTLLRTGLVGAGAMSFGSAFWRSALAADPAKPGPSPYGELSATFDANGLRLPPGFTSRIVAIGGEKVAGTEYVFPGAPDGAATYTTSTGGWIFAVNSELRDVGGVSAIRFAKDGSIESAQRVLGNTTLNCSGGKTPWQTWLSGEEYGDGAIWECDPRNPAVAKRLPALGIFQHEAVAVDHDEGIVYLTEDVADGNFYRFVADRYPSLDSGVLEAAIVNVLDGSVRWAPVPRPLGGSKDPTRKQVPGATVFPRGEGIWLDSGVVYVVTTNDKRVHAYDTKTQRIEVLFDGLATPDAPLKDPDNICAHAPSHDLFVCEDSATPKVAIITPDRIVASFADMNTNGIHGGSEATGPAFTPDGSRFLFSSQRAFGGKGAVLEITGPFRGLPTPTPTPTATASPAPTPAATVAPAATPTPAATATPTPNFGVTAAKSVTFALARSRGITVRFTTGKPYKVTAVLKTRVRQNGRLKTVTIGRLTKNVDAGPETLVVKLNSAGKALLKNRKTQLTTTLEVTIGTVKSTRTVRLKPRK